MIKKRIFIVLLLIVTLSTYVVATTETNATEIISVSDEQVGLGSEFYLILNLSNISFTKFQVDIVNTESLSAEELTSEVSSLATNSVATTFTVDKNTINLDKLGIVFTAPKMACNITFEVTITGLDETVETLKENQEELKLEIDELESQIETFEKLIEDYSKNNSEEVTSAEESDSLKLEELYEQLSLLKANLKTKENEYSELTNKILNFEPETLEAKADVKVTENGTITSKETLEKELEEEMTKSMKEMTEMNEQMNEKMSSLQSDLDSAQQTISSLTQNVTYQGSQNNYLSSLSISEIEFDSAFKKTTDTYFANVDETVTKVTVNATAEDSSAIITTYGNTALEEGLNKILITVTADDGSVRTYKIYITK